MLRFVSPLVLVLVATAAFSQIDSSTAEGPFEISVHLGPPVGQVIPAGMVNGRPVYVFHVIVKGADGRPVAGANRLLQPGDTKPVKSRKLPSGHVRAVVSISDPENASYTVEYVRDGKTLARTSASMHLTPRRIDQPQDWLPN